MIKALLLIYAIWGFNWVAMKEATLFFPPVLFACYRFAVGAAILLAVNAWLKLPLPPRRYWKWIALTGLLQIAGNNAAMQMGIKDLDAGLVAVLNYSMPVWVAILAHFFLNEKLTKRKALGVVVSMIGLVILMHIDSLGNASSLFITIGGAISWAVANVVIKYQNSRLKGKDCNMIQYTAWQMTIGSIILFVYTSCMETGQVHWTPMAVACLAYNGILASALAFFLWNYVLTCMEASKASIAVLAVPVVGVVCGILFLGERLYVSTAAGMVLILAGIILIVAQNSKPLSSRFHRSRS